MKYKYKQNQYKINLQYTDEPPVSYNSNENKLLENLEINDPHNKLVIKDKV